MRQAGGKEGKKDRGRELIPVNQTLEKKKGRETPCQPQQKEQKERGV